MVAVVRVDSPGPAHPARPDGVVELTVDAASPTFGFPSVTDAVDWGLRQLDRQPELRLAVELGEVDDPSGLVPEDCRAAVAALARVALPGQLVIGGLARRLMTDRTTDVAVELAEPPGAVAVAPSRGARPAPDLPRSLRGALAIPFAGRHEVRDQLVDVWARVRDGSPATVLVSGEAGSGKTRLLAEFAERVTQTGGTVLYGGATQASGAPLQPVIEALRPVLVDRASAVLDLVEPRAVADLARAFPGLVENPPQITPPTRRGVLGEQGHDAERYWGFEAVRELLTAAATERPIALLLDDLHWAGRPTLALVDHILRNDGSDGVCIVLAHRSTPADHGEAFSESLAQLHRHNGVDRVQLGGFEPQEVREFVELQSGLSASADDVDRVVEHLTERSAGNAFLVVESWRHLVTVGAVRQSSDGWSVGDLDSVDTAGSVRDVTAHRLARLSSSGRALLECAACCGTSFELAVVAAAVGQSRSVALDLLGQAERLGLVADQGRGRYEFAHALTRQAIEENLRGETRPRHHLALASILEGSGATDAALARHYAEAVPLVPASTAVARARSAARDFLGGVSFDEAVTLLDATLNVCDDGSDRAGVLIDLAAGHSRAGAAMDAARCALEAGDIARSMADTELLVGAARQIVEAVWRGSLHGSIAVPLLHEALDTVDDPATRCSLLAGLSTALAFSGHDAASAKAGDAAIDLARDIDDLELLVETIHYRLYSAITPGVVDEQYALAVEGVHVARRLGDEYAELRLACKAVLRLFVRSDPPALADASVRTAELADKLRQPYYLQVKAGNDMTLALAEGRFDDVEPGIDEYQRWTQVNGQGDSGYGLSMFSLRREQGRLAELRPVLELGRRLSTDPWLPGLAAVYAEVGLLDEAREILDELVDGGLALLPDDTMIAGTLSYLADAAFETGHIATAEQVVDRLGPYAGLMVYVPGTACYGAADRYLGRAFDVLGDTVSARRSYDDALELDRSTGWPTWIAHSAFALGRHLLHHGRRADRTRGLELVLESREAASELGMVTLRDRCLLCLDELEEREAHGRPVRLTPREVDVLKLVARGLSNREVGEALHTSRHTVANHVRAVLQKTGCANRTEAAAWAFGQGLVDPS